MIEFHAIILIIIASIEFILGLYIFIKGPKNEIRRWFSLFVFSISIWVGSLGVDLIVESKDLVVTIGYIPWISAVFAVCSLLFFTWIWPFKIKSIGKWHWIAIILPIIIFTFLIISPIAPVVEHTQLDEWRTNVKGVSYGFYNLFISLYLIWSFINIILRYRKSDGIHRWQLKYFLFGIFIATIVILATNIIMPWFEINNWFIYESIIGPEASIIFVGFSIYILFKK